MQQLFVFLVDFGDIIESPMKRMRPPKVTETPVPVIAEEHMRRLLATAAGSSFEERRDTAIMRLFIDTGMRSLRNDIVCQLGEHRGSRGAEAPGALLGRRATTAPQPDGGSGHAVR